MKLKYILTDAEIDDLGSMNPKMRDMLSRVKADDQAHAVTVASQKEKERQARADAMGEKGIQDYVRKLKAHDWSYDYSDDQRVWDKGSSERKEIRRLQQILDPDFDIYNQYAPQGFKVKVRVGEMTTASVATSMGGGNGFVNGGPGTLSRAGTTTTKKKKDKKMRKNVKEGLADLAQRAEHDHEVQMARADLYKIAKYAIKLHDMLKSVSEEEGLEGWQQAKITKAADYISSVYHNLDYDLKFGEGVTEGKQKMGSAGQAKGKDPMPKKSKPSKDGEQKHPLKDKLVGGESYKKDLSNYLQQAITEKSKGLYANVHAKRKRGEKPNPPGHPDRPSKKDWDDAAKTAKESIDEVCSECGNPSWRTLEEEKQKGSHGKVCWKGYRRGKGNSCHKVKGDG